MLPDRQGKYLDYSANLSNSILQNMALSSFQLFMSQAQNAPPDLKLQVFKVVLDLLIMYPQEFFGRNDDIVSH